MAAVYGMTEVGTMITVPYEEGGAPLRKPGSIGVPLQNILIKVSQV